MKHNILVIARWAAAVVCMISAYIMGSRVTASSEAAEVGVAMGFGSVMPLLYSLAFLVFGVICIAPELMHWGSIPFRMLTENLLYPNERGVPPPDYTLTRLYSEQGRYDEALEQYETIVSNHPEEFLAYVEAINLAFDVGQPEVAEKFFKRGMSKLGAEEFRTHLQSIYEEAKARPREEVVEEEEVVVEEQAVPVEEEQPEPRVWRDHPNL